MRKCALGLLGAMLLSSAASNILGIHLAMKPWVSVTCVPCSCIVWHPEVSVFSMAYRRILLSLGMPHRRTCKWWSCLRGAACLLNRVDACLFFANVGGNEVGTWVVLCLEAGGWVVPTVGTEKLTGHLMPQEKCSVFWVPSSLTGFPFAFNCFFLVTVFRASCFWWPWPCRRTNRPGRVLLWLCLRFSHNETGLQLFGGSPQR